MRVNSATAPAATSFEGKPFDLSFEFSIDTIFGSGNEWDGVTVTVIAPGASVLFNLHFDQWSDSEFMKHFVAYAGGGVAVPIQFAKIKYYDWRYYRHSDENWYWDKYTHDEDSTVVSVDLTTMIGARYAFSDNFEVNAETGFNLIGRSNWFLRGGVMFRF